MAEIIQIRRATAAIAATNNVTLAEGEMGFETDTGKFKFGDGVTAWNDLPYAEGEKAVAATGTSISFTASTIYNTAAAPATGNITNDLTSARLGLVQKIYHNHTSEPTFPTGWVLFGGKYKTDELNIIYAEWASGTRVEYWIIQETT